MRYPNLSYFLTMLFIIAAAGFANAATFTVTNTDDSGAGSLRQAILSSNTSGTNDTINFDSGVFNVPRTITLTTGELLIEGANSLEITGPGSGLLTISGNDQFRVFEIKANATISGLTVTLGYNVGTGSSSVGGGIGINNGGVGNATMVTLNNLIVTNNRVQSNNSGGGIGCFRIAALTINNSVISNNRANGGGGISLGGGLDPCGDTTINNSTIINNSGGSSGGGAIFCCGNINNNDPLGTLSITGSTLSNNTSNNNGSAIRFTGTQRWGLSMKNSTVSGNTGSPALQIFRASLDFDSVTVAFNSYDHPTRTGGIYFVDDISAILSRNNIIANNTNQAGGNDLELNGATFTSQGYNLLENIGSETISGTTTGNLIGVDPHLDAVLRNYGGPTKTLALLPGSPAIDAGDPTVFLPTDQRGIARPQNGGTALRSDIGAFERRTIDLVPRNIFDFDGDGITDLGIFRPAPGEWWYLKSSDGGNAALQFGTQTDKLVPADYTGDGKTDIGSFRPGSGEWFILRSEDFSFYSFPFGFGSDIPAPADFDGDGKADPAIFRPSSGTWYIQQSTGGTIITPFGANGDKPVPADYDGDSKADIAIFRSDGSWWLNRSQAGTIVATFGTSSDKTVPGDYTGDGKADVAFFRPSSGEWFVLRSEDFSFFSFPFGTSTDIPAPGDYDGDSKTDAGIFRPSNSTWYINRSNSGILIQGFGSAGDYPVPNCYVR